MDFLTYLKQKREQTSPESAPTKTSFFNSPILTGLASKVPSWMDTLGNKTIDLTKSIVRDPMGTASRGVNAVGNFVMGTKTFQQMLDDQSKASKTLQTGDDIDVFAKPAAGFAKFLLQEIAAGTVSIGKSLDQASGFKDFRDKYGALPPDPEGQKALEEKLFGRQVKSIQDAYIDPTLKYADSQGSGTFEKGVLGFGAGLGGFLIESPIGAPAKKEISVMAREFVTSRASREIIERDVAKIGLTEDATRELSDSISAIVDSGMRQGEKKTQIQNLIEDVMNRSRAVENGPAKSVVQVVTKSGDNVFYEVDPATLKVLSEDLIDGTGRGIAGREIDGNIYHLTAKTPSEMLERSGWRNGGKKTLDDIVSMITPKKRVAVRTEDGRFAGSFMEETPAFKLAGEKRAAQDTEALTRRSLDDMSEFDMSITEAKSAFRNMFDEKEMDFVFRDSFDNIKQTGRFSRPFKSMVEVVQKNGKVQSSTVYHEAFHAYFNTFISAAQRQEILGRLKASPSTALSRGAKAFEGYRGADVRAEEWLADDFARYVRELSQNKKPTSIFADVWRKVYTKIRQMIRKANHVDQLYQDILERRRTGFVEKRKLREIKFKGGPLPDTPRSPGQPEQRKTTEKKQQIQESQKISTDETLSQVYPDDVVKAIDKFAQHNNVDPSIVENVFKKIKQKKTVFLENVQNTEERVRQMIESGKYEVTDASNIYQKATLASGRMGARIEKMKDEVKEVLEDIRETGKMLGREYDDLKGDIDDYLIARHAPERNAAIGEGAAGMTTAEAETLMRKLESGPNGAEIKRIADKVQKLNNETLDILLKSQVITEDLHALLRERYQYHVPLYRVQEADVDFGGALTGRGFDVRSTGVKRAKGSDKEIDDVIGNVMYNYEQAIIRSEKNIVDLAVAKFVDDNNLKKGDIMHRTQLPFMPVGVATHKGQVFHEVMDKVNELVTKYGGTHERKLRSGKAFGYYQPAGNKIVTRFGTSKDTLIHEFGHMLDTHFGMRESDFFTNDISAELRAIADLRDSVDPAVVAQRTKSRERYVRSGPEKIAEFISTYFSDMETARRVAPKATEKFTRFLDDKPELRELSDVMKSRARSEELMQETLFAQQKFTNDPQILTFRENGKAAYIKINDKNLAVAIRGVGREKLGFLAPLRTFVNFYSGLNTRFTPEFALPNKLRDIQEVVVYLSSQKDLKASSVAKVGFKDPKSIKDVTDFLRGKDTEGARLYREMKEAGGTTGGMGLSTREQTGLDMKKMDKLMNSKTRRTTEKLIEYVDNWNTIFEDSTRLSVYREARAQGLSKERAAFLAKEASINFNRMGKGGPVINALWMFSNASIQGSTKMLRALKNPKVLAGVVTTVGVSVAAVNEWNDSVDPEWREKVPKWDRMNSLPVVLPSEEDGKFNYFAIPVSWGIKPIKVMADYATDAMSGHAKSAKEITEGIITSILEGYNPVGGTDIISAISPTILDAPFEIARNMSWSGAKITPINYNNAPDDTLYFSSLPETQVGRAAISLSELLAKGGIEVSPANMKYAYEQYVGGAGRFITRLFNTVAGATTGDPVPLDEYPFIARFYRERSGDELEYTKSTETETLENLEDEDARAKKKLSVQATQIKDEIMELPTAEEKKARLKEISTQNPELAKKVLDYIEDDKAGLTPQESQLKGATVKVRAEYIRRELETLTTPEEKRAYLKDLQAKKILTASVMDELGL